MHFIPKIINAKSTATVFKVPKNEGEKKTLIMLFMLHVRGAAAEPMFGQNGRLPFSACSTPSHRSTEPKGHCPLYKTFPNIS